MFSNIVGVIKKGHLSNPRRDSKFLKGKVTRVLVKNQEMLQLSLFTDKQAFHENFTDDTICERLVEVMNEYFFQSEIQTDDKTYFYKITGKGKLLTNVKKQENLIQVKAHNKKKNYILEEGTVIPCLVDLGIMNDSGFVVKAYFDKYKQINRFLEIIDDTIGDEDNLNIIDFGCGKSYLTFILYYYLEFIKKINFNIIGLDLKSDVIDKCNNIRDKYNYNKLNFELGDISLYKPVSKVDMIITLHACDTATDYAIYHAIKLNTKYLLSVPCCQHEVNAQMTLDSNVLVNKYGILKERYSSILTDAIRGNILEYYGYNVNIMEFIDIAHSPKNLLIKAIFTGKRNLELKEKIIELVEQYNINPTLYQLLITE